MSDRFQTVVKLRASQEIIYVILYHLLIFSIFFGEAVLSFPVPTLGSIYLFRIVLAVISIFTGYRIFVKKERIDFTGSIKYLLMLFIVVTMYGVISIAFAENQSSTIGILINWVINGIFVVVVICFNSNKNRIKHTFIAVLYNVVIAILLGILETFTGSLFFREESIGRGRIAFFNFGINELPLVYGTNQNYLVTLIMFGVLLSLLFIFCQVAKPKYVTKKKWYSATVPFLLVGGFYISHYSISTLGQFTLIITAITTIMILVFVVNKKKIPISAISIVVGYLLVLLASNFIVILPRILNIFNLTYEIPSLYPNPVMFGLKSFYEGASGSGNERLVLIQYGMRLFIRSKGLGVGLGNTLFFATMDNSIPYGDLHCFPVRLVSDCGVFALVPLCMFVLSIVRNWYKYLKEYYTRSLYHRVRILFSGLVFFVSPFVVTIPSDAQNVWLMWLFYAILAITLDPKRMSDVEYSEEPI